MTGPYRAESPNGMVVAPHFLASEAGADALRQGGTAADAIIATNAVLTVVYPHMCAIGGDLFTLGWTPGDGLWGLNGSGRAAAQASPAWYRERGFDGVPFKGPEAALTVPGCVDGWWQLHRKYGRLQWSRLFERAIALAEEGAEASKGLARGGRADLDDLRRSPQLIATFVRNDAFLAEGDRFKQPELADTFRKIALGGPDAFYRGEIARRMASAFEADGSPLRLADLSSHTTDWFTPVTTGYRGYEAAALHPDTQGVVYLEALAVLEGFDTTSMGARTAELTHHQVEALKLALEDRNRWIGDDERSAGVVERMLDPEYIAAQRARIGARALQPAASGSGDTCYFCAADGEGMAISAIESVYAGFGAAYVAGDTGVIIQDRGASFNFTPGHPNSLEGGRRPMHTLTPAMLLKDGKPALVFGNMGGGAQPQFLAQIAQSYVDFGLDAPAAVAAPRWTYGPLFVGAEGALTVEAGLAGAVDGLRALGHDVWDPLREFSDNMGHASAIEVLDNGVLVGGGDPRADSAAVGA